MLSNDGLEYVSSMIQNQPNLSYLIKRHLYFEPLKCCPVIHWKSIFYLDICSTQIILQKYTQFEHGILFNQVKINYLFRLFTKINVKITLIIIIKN